MLSSTVYLPARGDAMAEADDDMLAIEHWEMEDGTRVIPFSLRRRVYNRR
ncbi:hypothetical protein O0544_12085 [Edwardsiella anguillarum]|nr:hypothetical protein [Edwardsiella anguillarum]